MGCPVVPAAHNKQNAAGNCILAFMFNNHWRTNALWINPTPFLTCLYFWPWQHPVAVFPLQVDFWRAPLNYRVFSVPAYFLIERFPFTHLSESSGCTHWPLNSAGWQGKGFSFHPFLQSHHYYRPQRHHLLCSPMFVPLDPNLEASLFPSLLGSDDGFGSWQQLCLFLSCSSLQCPLTCSEPSLLPQHPQLFSLLYPKDSPTTL